MVAEELTSMRRTNRPTSLLAVVAVVIALGVVAARVSAQWIEPSTQIPPVSGLPGTNVLPLNTSGAAQTKTGPLTVWNSVTAMNDLTVNGSICWNGTDSSSCKASWQGANVGNYVRLQTSSTRIDDSGFISVSGPSGTAVLQTSAADPTEQTAVARVGLVGRAARSTEGTSYGVVGSAGTADLANHYGVFATDGGSPNSFAARFNGDVAFVGLPGESDLIIGQMYKSDGSLLDAIVTARNDAVSDVCLNGVCKSAWDSVGASQWAFNASANTVWPGNTGRSLSIGNGTFIITLDTLKSPPVATMSVAGDFSAHKVVIGTPSQNLINYGTMTCGDNICSVGENACPDDCDKVPPAVVTGISSTPPDASGYVTLMWTAPASSDFGGTRIIVTDGIKPRDPSDGVVTDVLGLPGGSSQARFGPFGQGKQYFWLYSYDLTRTGAPLNFSQPVGYQIQL